MEMMFGTTLILLGLSLAYNLFLGVVIKKLNDDLDANKPPF
jgi:hypothetical protein